MRRRLLSWFLLAAPVLAAAVSLTGRDASAKDDPAAYPVMPWRDLVPKDWDPTKLFRDKRVDRMKEGSAGEMALMREMREIWDNAPTRADLDGAKVRVPGYVVPLENAEGAVKEFLLVPYFGACVHSPPPPANQIIHVVLAKPQALRTMDAIWLSGTLRTKRADSPWGKSGYAMEGKLVEPYKPQSN